MNNYMVSPPGLKPTGPLYYRNTREGFCDYYVVWGRVETYPSFWQEVARYKRKASAYKLLNKLKGRE